MKLGIYGAGSLGTILGAYLTQHGVEVDLISRNKAHIAGLQTHGARIIGTVDMTVKVKALLPEDMTGQYDIIFLMTKQLDNPTVVKALLPQLSSDGVICTTQNGLPELGIAEIIGEQRTYGCAIGWGAEMLGEGVCKLTSDPQSLSFSLGALHHSLNTPHFLYIKKVLAYMGKVECDENFIGARFSKLLINTSFSGMSAVLGETFGVLAKDKKSRYYVQKIMKECLDVANKAGIVLAPMQGKDMGKLLNYNNKLKEKWVFFLIPILIKKHSGLKASMLQDLEHKRLTEVDSINGVIAQYGRKVGVPTPVNDKVCQIVHEIEEGKRAPSRDNLSLFKKA